MKISKTKIELILAKKNLKIVEAAKIMGMTRQTFSTIKNRGTCTPATAAKIANGLGVKVEDLIDNNES